MVVKEMHYHYLLTQKKIFKVCCPVYRHTPISVSGWFRGVADIEGRKKIVDWTDWTV